jgi:hypothetical protein
MREGKVGVRPGGCAASRGGQAVMTSFALKRVEYAKSTRTLRVG